MLWIDHPGQPGNRWSRVAEILFGRSTELALIGAFVERAGTGGEALLLAGEAGAGKTALLDAAAGAAEEAGTRVLRAAGVEFEADLTYSGLHQVLLPLFAQVPAAGRRPQGRAERRPWLRGGAAAGSAAGVHRHPHGTPPERPRLGQCW